jgi:hypothetical protein
LHEAFILDVSTVQGAATLRAKPLGKLLRITGTLPSGKLLCVKDGETVAQEFDPADLFIFPIRPVDRATQKG